MWSSVMPGFGLVFSQMHYSFLMISLKRQSKFFPYTSYWFAGGCMDSRHHTGLSNWFVVHRATSLSTHNCLCFLHRMSLYPSLEDLKVDKVIKVSVLWWIDFRKTSIWWNRLYSLKALCYFIFYFFYFHWISFLTICAVCKKVAKMIWTCKTEKNLGGE